MTKQDTGNVLTEERLLRIASAQERQRQRRQMKEAAASSVAPARQSKRASQPARTPEQLRSLHASRAGRASAAITELRTKVKTSITSEPETWNSTDGHTRLPAWFESVRGIPNVFARSSLFGIFQSEDRGSIVDDYPLQCVRGWRMYLTGYRLNQADGDIWMTILHLARERGLTLSFSAREMLRASGRTVGSSQLAWLYETIRRLYKASILVVRESDGQEFHFHLLGDGTSEAAGDESLYTVTVSPVILAFFDPTEWTALIFEQRHALQRKLLAQWLHMTYSTHRRPYEYRVETIHELCESRDELRFFKQTLKRALDDLTSVTGWLCWITGSGLVIVAKEPTAEQRAEYERAKADEAARKARRAAKKEGAA